MAQEDKIAKPIYTPIAHNNSSSGIARPAVLPFQKMPAVVQRIMIDKTIKPWKATENIMQSDVDTEQFRTVQEYEDFLAKYSEELKDLKVSIEAECEERKEAVKKEYWYQSAAHLGFDVEGLLEEPLDFNISKSEWNKTLTEDQLLFHATRRTPEDTLGKEDQPGTGFVSANLRGSPGTDQPVKWRTGFDDIELLSGVCLAKDVRGTAFFPLTGAKPKDGPDKRALDDKEPIYLYAIRIPKDAKLVDTYGAQSRLEEYQRNQQDERPTDEERLAYDPGYEIDDGENADCRWQFQEHAVPEVKPDQIVGVWRVERKRFIETILEGGERAGVRFRIHEESLFDALLKPAVGSENVAAKAKEIVAQYKTFYPRDESHYLSYMGIIKQMGTVPTSFEEARGSAETVKHDVTNKEEPGLREGEH
jgi:hypothetical protein